MTCNENYTNYSGNCYPEGYITEYVTEYHTEYITDYITQTDTEYITDYITQTDTQYITDYITQTDTQYMTDYITQTNTQYMTDYITQNDTQYMTDYITQTDTEYMTDYITQTDKEYITESKTDSISEILTDFITESEKMKESDTNIETVIQKNCTSVFYSKKNNECLKICSYDDLLNDNCGVKDSENKNTIINNLIKEYIMKNYTDGNLIIEGEDDFIFQLTNSLNERNTKDGIDSNDYNLSMIDLGECEEKLKEKNNIGKDESLIIYKLEKVGTIASQKNIQYEVYNPYNLEKLDLSICTNEKINIFIPITLSEDKLELHKDLLSYGYDLFNPNDSFYQDICTEYTSANGTDVLLSDRRENFFNDTETACQKGCTYSQYSAETKQLKCECDAKEETIEPEQEKMEQFDGSIIFTSFYDVLRLSNFRVLKCYKLVFSYKGEYHNWGSLILIGYFIIYTAFNIMYFVKGFFYARLYSAKMIFNNNILNNNINIKNNSQRTNKRSKSVFVGNPLRKQKSKSRITTIRLSERKDSSTLKILMKSSRKDGNSNSSLFNKEEKKNNFNYEITQKDIKEQKKDKTRKSLRSKTSKSFLKRDSKKRKTFDNSIQILKRFGNNFNDNKNINSYSNGKNANKANINNRNSIEVYNKNSKDLSLKKTKKKGLLSYFKANNFDDFELNELPYKKAVDYDKRSFFYFYWQLLRREHLIFFTFFSWGDNNIFAIKLSKFIFAISLDFAINVVFFVDESMHKIYVNYGKYNFIAQIPQILYSTVAAESLDVFLRYLSIIEKDVYKINKFEQKKNKVIAKQQIFKVLKCMKIKLIFYFVVTFFLMCFFWYFIAAFCAVYKNTQLFLIKDSMVSLLMSLLYPFGLYLLPTALRIIAIRDKKKRLSFLYKLSDIIPLI